MPDDNPAKANRTFFQEMRRKVLEGWRVAKESGARNFIILSVIVSVSSVVFYSLSAINYGEYVDLLALAIALMVAALVEARFWEVREILRVIERKLDSQQSDDTHQPSVAEPSLGTSSQVGDESGREIEARLTELRHLTDELTTPPASPDSGLLRARELARITLAQMELTYSINKRQHEDSKQLVKSSKRLEDSTRLVVMLTLLFIGVTLFLSIIGKAQSFSLEVALGLDAVALGMLLVFVFVGVWTVQKLRNFDPM